MKFIRFILNYFLCVIFLIVSLPFQILIFVLLIIDLKEFPLFIQDRGLTLTNGRFRMIKFRTIKSVKADNVRDSNNFLTPVDETKITSFANFLRSTGLDELPQLFHVLSGKMNLVGPRPLMISDIEIMKNQYPDFYAARNTINLKPGITGNWQLCGDKNSGIEDLAKYDLLYLHDNSLRNDLKIILITFRYVFLGIKKTSKT